MAVEVRTTSDLRALSSTLRRMGPSSKRARRMLTNGLRRAAEPAARDARAELEGWSVSGSSTRGLRRAVGKAIRVQARPGGRDPRVAVVVDPRRLPADMIPLPALIEGLRRWRHPVWGNRDAWVDQAAHPFFYAPMRRNAHRARAQVERVARQIAAEIDRSV